MVNKTLFDVCLKSIMKGGNIGNEIYEYIVIGVIIICLIVFGPVLYKLLNTLGKVADAGDKVIGGVITLAGEITEGMAYCYNGSKNPSQKCDDDTKKKAEESFSGTGGFNVCSNCTPPCLLNDIDCTVYDVFGILGLIFGSFAIFAGLYCRATGVSCPSPIEALKEVAKNIKDLIFGSDGEGLDKIKERVNDPDSVEAKEAEAIQDRENAEEKREAADAAKEEATKEGADKEAQSKFEELEKQAKEAENQAEMSEKEATEAREEAEKGKEGKGGAEGVPE
jgi:hypothetical protein